MIKRRKLVITLGAGALLAPLRSFAQQRSAKIPRIGILGWSTAAGYARQIEAFRSGLRELGYVEGRNIILEFRWADGNRDRLRELATELVRLNVDVLVCSGPGVGVAKRATTTIPIVAAVSGDMVAQGFVDNLARPGGNLTGSTFFFPELMAKRLELLKDVLPRIQRVAILVNLDNASMARLLGDLKSAGASLKVELHQFEARHSSEFEGALKAISERRMEAVMVADDALFVGDSGPLARGISGRRMPSIGFIELAESGGLMAYGVDFPALYRRAAQFVDKILKGAHPGEIPIQRATTFILVVNMKSAKALGITIPQAVLIRADKVIE